MLRSKKSKQLVRLPEMQRNHSKQERKRKSLGSFKSLSTVQIAETIPIQKRKFTDMSQMWSRDLKTIHISYQSKQELPGPSHRKSLPWTRNYSQNWSGTRSPPTRTLTKLLPSSLRSLTGSISMKHAVLLQRPSSRTSSITCMPSMVTEGNLKGISSQISK